MPVPFLTMGSVYLASLGFCYPFVVVYSIANIEGYCVAVPLNPISEFGIGLAFLLVQKKGSCSFDVHDVIMIAILYLKPVLVLSWIYSNLFRYICNDVCAHFATYPIVHAIRIYMSTHDFVAFRLFIL